MNTFAVLAVCDRAYTGEREDVSGPVVIEIAETRGYVLAHYGILCNEQPFVSAELVRLCDDHIADVVFTTGGTGLGAAAVTPDATKDVLEKHIRGIVEALRFHALQTSKKAMFSRAIAGTRGRTLVINLPGCPEAVRSCMDYLIDELAPALEKLKSGAEV